MMDVELDASEYVRADIHDRRVTELLEYNNSVLERARKAEAELAEMNRIFDLRHKADMRAIKKWHQAGGDSLTWPDHADLVCFLMLLIEKSQPVLGIAKLKGITLGPRYAGKITEQEALDLVNTIIETQQRVASGDFEEVDLSGDDEKHTVEEFLANKETQIDDQK